jgi:phytoene desaturase
VARIAVIGAGMGGMAAAARLRAKGHDVFVVEQSAKAGGKLARYERDGFVFDTGPSLFTLPAVYRDLFLKTGGALEDSVDIVALDNAFGYHWSDGSHADLPGVDPGRIAQALGAALGPESAADWRALIEHAGNVWALTRRPFLESPLDGLRTLLPLARHWSDIRTVAPFTSLRTLGTRMLKNPRLVMLLDRYATYTGSDPRRAPAALVTVPYVEQAFGAWHLGGGIATLSDALAKRCVDLGVTFQFNTDITHIDTNNTGVTGIRCANGDMLSADIVVANADATHLYNDLVTDARGRRPRRHLRRATPSLSGFVLLLGVHGRTEGLSHHNVWFPHDYDAEFDSIFGRRAKPVSDPTIYACVPDDPLMRPSADHESWFILINAPRHGTGPGCVDWSQAAMTHAYADHILDVLAERGVDIRNRIMWREIRTPLDLQTHTRAPGGAIYGSSSNGSRSAFLRPANISPIPGLYLVGGSAHPGGGLPLVGLSAQIVTEHIGRA